METDIKEELPNLIENAAVVVLYLDHSGNILFCNRKTESVSGLKRDDIISKNWLEVLFKKAQL